MCRLSFKSKYMRVIRICPFEWDFRCIKFYSQNITLDPTLNKEWQTFVENLKMTIFICVISRHYSHNFLWEHFLQHRKSSKPYQLSELMKTRKDEKQVKAFPLSTFSSNYDFRVFQVFLRAKSFSRQNEEITLTGMFWVKSYQD